MKHLSLAQGCREGEMCCDKSGVGGWYQHTPYSYTFPGPDLPAQIDTGLC